MENLNKYIDHTLLKRDVTKPEILKAMDDAIEYKFATLCIAPTWIEVVAPKLHENGVKVTTVIGFPFGQNTIESKVAEAKDAIEKGADELDFVINVSRVHDNDVEYLKKEVAAMRASTQGKVIKLIIETNLLSNDEKRMISQIAIDGGFDFIKTSTGIGVDGATVEDVKLMKEIAGNKEVKASGGVRTLDAAIAMIEAGATRIGTSNGVDIINGLEGKNAY